MQNSELPIRPEEVRALFDLPEDVTYLNCANMAPQMRAVTEAGLRAVRQKSTPWTLTDWFSPSEELRGLAAQVFDTDKEGVALVPAASYGVAIAAANVPLQTGQSIVVLRKEFPSNFYSWHELARRSGGSVVTAKRNEHENWTDALLRVIDKNTAIVAVPQCHWTDGAAVDLEKVSDRVREVGAALVIDASQSLGAAPLNIQRIQPDFVVSVGYKWLLGPYGLGYLYVAPKWRSGVPLERSWLTRAGSDDFTTLGYTEEFRPGARRFDMGEFPQFALTPMAIAALRQIVAWGVPRIAQTILVLTDRAAEQAEKLGYTVSPRKDRAPHMIGIRKSGGIPVGLPQFLRERNIFASVRGDSIRIAPHLYNSVQDVDRLFAAISEFQDNSAR